MLNNALLEFRNPLNPNELSINYQGILEHKEHTISYSLVESQFVIDSIGILKK